ncbi:MAG: hypothetical protein NTW87_37420 [Planctomycetota bacterium]|nr:hypothetical protein [Planctomycetota bacterium]
MAEARRCWKCNASYPADTVICVRCGVNLVTGEQTGGGASADGDAAPTRFGRLLNWLADTLPGLFRLRIVVAAVVVSLAAAFVFWLSLVLLLAAPVSAFPIGAFGLIMYGQALAWLLSGEFTLIHVAMSEFRGKDWSNFVLLLFLPIVLGFAWMRHKVKAEEAAEAGLPAPAEEEESPAAEEAEYVISSVTPAAGPFFLGGKRSPLALDADGNFYFAETNSHRVCKFSPVTATVSAVAGTGEQGVAQEGSPAAKAGLNFPSSVAVDRQGILYIADAGFVRRADGKGIIKDVVGALGGERTGDGGPARTAEVRSGTQLCTDARGNLYLLDSEPARVRKVDMATGIINTAAGTGKQGYSGDGGPATEAALRWPRGIAVDPQGNLLIADTGNGRVRRVDARSATIETIAGTGEGGFKGLGGPAKAARIGEPSLLTADPQGNVFFVAHNNRVFKIDAATGILSVAAGTGRDGEPGDGGPATQAALNSVGSIIADAKGTIFVGDQGNHVIRKLERVKR